jgi:hypothetical protein
MLSLLFSSLQSSLNTVFSKPYLVGSFLPLALFVAACTAMAYHVGGLAQSWAALINPVPAAGSATPWNVAAALLVVSGLAVVLSGLNGFLLELLEGKRLGWLTPWLHALELNRFRGIDQELKRCQIELFKFDSPAPGGGAPAWARLISSLQSGPFTGGAPPAGKLTIPEPVRAALRKRRLGLLVTFAELSAAEAALRPLLMGGLTPALDRLKDEMVDAIQYGRERLLLEANRLHHLRQLQFPMAATSQGRARSLNTLAATRMGNITRTIRSYALGRFHLDLNIFWTRLQGAMVKEKDGLAALQDSKVQVDFLVSLFWLTGLFVVLWSGLLIGVTPRPRDFLAVAIGGPIAARCLYLAACQNYLLFADQMRSAIDLYRSDLVDQLHLPKPSGNREEQAMWDRVGGWLGYADECDINYKQ